MIRIKIVFAKHLLNIDIQYKNTLTCKCLKVQKYIVDN